MLNYQSQANGPTPKRLSHYAGRGVVGYRIRKPHRMEWNPDSPAYVAPAED